jgi:hypothetical protein
MTRPLTTVMLAGLVWARHWRNDRYRIQNTPMSSRPRRRPAASDGVCSPHSSGRGKER